MTKSLGLPAFRLARRIFIYQRQHRIQSARIHQIFRTDGLHKQQWLSVQMPGPLTSFNPHVQFFSSHPTLSRDGENDELVYDLSPESMTTTSLTSRCVGATAPDDKKEILSMLDSFALDTLSNVRKVVALLSEISKQSIGASTERKTVQDRWQKVYEKEMERAHRRRRTRWSKKNLPVRQAWKEALHSSRLSLRVTKPDVEIPPTVNHFSQETAFEEDFIINMTDIPGETSPTPPFSPVFKAPLDSQIKIENIDLLPTDLRYHHDSIPSELPEMIDEEDINANENLSVDQRRKLFHDAVAHAVSLLLVTGPEDWRSVSTAHKRQASNDVDRTRGTSVEQEESEKEQENIFRSETEASFVSRVTVCDLLGLVMDRKLSLSTSEINLLLAHLISSAKDDSNTAGSKCMQLFTEMQLLAESGRRDCHPDATTYRILILAHVHRFMAPREAIRLSQVMMSDKKVTVTPEVFLDAMRVCHAKMDLKAAQELLHVAITEKTVRPSVGSHILLIEMMKIYDLQDEALKHFCRLHEADALTKDEADKLLFCICRWPRKTRRGDFVDLSLFLTEILSLLQRMVAIGKKPSTSVWTKLAEEMHMSARRDPSLWKDITSALNTVLESYTEDRIDRSLVAIGLEASEFCDDPSVAARILRKTIGSNRHSQLLMAETMISGADGPAPPYQAVKSVLQTCLKVSDAESAESIVDSVHKFNCQYPVRVMSEMYSLLLLCHAEVKDSEKALEDLLTMIEKNMHPGDELFGAVIQSLAESDRQSEAETLFQNMEDGLNGFEIRPASFSYDALLFSRAQSCDWDGVLSLYSDLEAKGVRALPRSVKSFISAHNHRDGKEGVIRAVNLLLQGSSAQFDEEVFRFVCGILLQDLFVDCFDDFRQEVRGIGEKETFLRDESLNLVKSVRVAEIESSRPDSSHKTQAEMQAVQDKAWADATFHLLRFAGARQNAQKSR